MSAFKIGDRIIYDGYPPAIPMRLADTKGTVEGTTRYGNLITRADEDAYGTRTIHPEWVRRVLVNGEWVVPNLPHKPECYR